MSTEITYLEHAGDVIARAQELTVRGERFALVTSVAIEGGAARDVGSLALVEASGAMAGYLSNGCIDRDIQLHAHQALKTGAARVIRYGNGSRFVDLKLPCGGALDVLIDPDPDIASLTSAHETLRLRRVAKLHFDLPDGGTAGFAYTPKFRMVLAGRGAIFRATAQVAVSAGFQLRLMLPDEDDLAALTGVGDAPHVHLTAPGQDVSFDVLDDHSAFLTLFHDHDWEPDLLARALSRPAAFIGCLGSRRTHEARLALLRARGVAEDDLARINGPIGLVSSLREAQLIAISAIAEIVALLPAGIVPLNATEAPRRSA